MNEDLKELLKFLQSHNVKFLVIGAHAVAFHGRPRFTEDLDLFFSREAENAKRLGQALKEFGVAIGETGISAFADQDRQMVRIGVPPAMADLLNFAGSRSFEEVWANRMSGNLEGIEVYFPSIDDLMEMKESAGRKQDLADLEALRKIQRQRK